MHQMPACAASSSGYPQSLTVFISATRRAAAAAAFEPKDLVDLTITIAAMNAFNRLGAPFRLPVAAKA
jgi:alkylhydroperoxidase family enzyme